MALVKIKTGRLVSKLFVISITTEGIEHSFKLRSINEMNMPAKRVGKQSTKGANNIILSHFHSQKLLQILRLKIFVLMCERDYHSKNSYHTR